MEIIKKIMKNSSKNEKISTNNSLKNNYSYNIVHLKNNVTNEKEKALAIFSIKEINGKKKSKLIHIEKIG